ncbi:MAG: hypothetical protein LLG04_09550 [Parachlamydia sp.]|nr:hypothetical protein [Parachlamydia sp.]
MSVNKIDPRNMHDAVMNKMDQVAVQKRSIAGKIFVKAPALFSLSVSALVTNVAAAATDAFILLGKLPLAAVKYGVLKTIRVITWTNAFESVQAKMPNGKSLLDLTSKLGAKVAGVFYSVVGLVLPTFNLRRQEELGNFVNQRKADQAAKAAKAAEAANAAEAQKAKEAQEAAAEAERQAQLLAKKNKEQKVIDNAKKAHSKAAQEAADVANMMLPGFKKEKEAQRALGRVAANDAAEVIRVRERLKDIAYLEQFAEAHLAMDGQPVRKAGFVVNGEAYTNKLFAKEDERRAVRLADIAELEQFAVAEELIQSNSKKEAPKMRALPDDRSEDVLVNAQRQQNELEGDLERMGAYQLNDVHAEDAMNEAQQIADAFADLERLNPVAEKVAAAPAPTAAPAVVAVPAKIATGYAGGKMNPFNWNLNPFRRQTAVS